MYAELGSILPKLSLNSSSECQQVFLSPAWSHCGQWRQDSGPDIIDCDHGDLVPSVLGVDIEDGPQHRHDEQKPTQSSCGSS